MFKRIFKCLGAIITVVAIAIAVFLVNLIWFRPWSLNLFYEKVFAEILFDHPEILTTLGLVEQFGITGHNGKLDDESPAHQQREFDRWKRDLRSEERRVGKEWRSWEAGYDEKRKASG